MAIKAEHKKLTPGSKQLTKQWEKRNTVGKDRVEELRALYEELGFEVKVEEYQHESEAGEKCNECFAVSKGNYFVIYTRKK